MYDNTWWLILVGLVRLYACSADRWYHVAVSGACQRTKQVWSSGAPKDRLPYTKGSSDLGDDKPECVRSPTVTINARMTLKVMTRVITMWSCGLGGGFFEDMQPSQGLTARDYRVQIFASPCRMVTVHRS